MNNWRALKLVALTLFIIDVALYGSLLSCTNYLLVCNEKFTWILSKVWSSFHPISSNMQTHIPLEPYAGDADTQAPSKWIENFYRIIPLFESVFWISIVILLAVVVRFISKKVFSILSR